MLALMGWSLEPLGPGFGSLFAGEAFMAVVVKTVVVDPVLVGR